MTKTPKGKIQKLAIVGEAAGKVNYPGKEQLTSVTEIAIGPSVEKWVARHFMRLVGYWHTHQVVGGRAQIIDRGMMSRRAAYQAEADFREVFGVDVTEWDPSMLSKFLGVEAPKAKAKRKA